ncbi:unnamed protein product, partial [Rotaria magnacalcarata]
IPAAADRTFELVRSSNRKSGVILGAGTFIGGVIFSEKAARRSSSSKPSNTDFFDGSATFGGAS